MTLRRTQSLCPVCLRRIDASYERSADNALTVVLRKTCPDHGTFSVPVWRESEPGAPATPPFTAWSRPKSPSYPDNPHTPILHGCPFDCGLCPAHAQHTCTGLFEVTMRCDMACPLCYAEAGSVSNQISDEAVDVPLSVIAAQMDTLKEASGSCNVQISGGEPTMRDDLPQIIGMARQRGFVVSGFTPPLAGDGQLPRSEAEPAPAKAGERGPSRKTCRASPGTPHPPFGHLLPQGEKGTP